MTRVDLRTNRISATIPVGPNAGGLAAGERAVWVTHGGSMSRIDPQTNRIVQTFRVGAAVRAVAVSRDALFVADAGDRAVKRVDPHSGRVTAVYRFGGRQPSRLLLRGNALWVTSYVVSSYDCRNVITKIDLKA